MKHCERINGRPARGLGLRLAPETLEALERVAEQRRGKLKDGRYGAASVAREVLNEFAARQRRAS